MEQQPKVIRRQTHYLPGLLDRQREGIGVPTLGEISRSLEPLLAHRDRDALSRFTTCAQHAVEAPTVPDGVSDAYWGVLQPQLAKLLGKLVNTKTGRTKKRNLRGQMGQLRQLDQELKQLAQTS